MNLDLPLTKTRQFLLLKVNSEMTKFLCDVEGEVWKAFKLVATSKNKKLKEAVIEAIENYIRQNPIEHLNVDFKIVENNKKNLLTFVYEEELKDLLEACKKAKEKNTPYVNDLRKKILDLVKKNPEISKELAQEIVCTLKVIKAGEKP